MHMEIADKLVAMYVSLLKDICGGCEVDSRGEGPGKKFTDFAHLARAPTLFCFGSSFCHWAGMGNPGTVYTRSTTLAGGPLAGGQEPVIDSNWYWVNDEPELTLKNSDLPGGDSSADRVNYITEWAP